MLMNFGVAETAVILAAAANGRLLSLEDQWSGASERPVSVRADGRPGRMTAYRREPAMRLYSVSTTARGREAVVTGSGL